VIRALLLLGLLALAPQAALAHGGAHEPRQEKPQLVGHPCPGGAGECCCAKSLSAGGEPPAIAAPGWHIILQDFAGPQAIATAARPKDVLLFKDPSAPPPSS